MRYNNTAQMAYENQFNEKIDAQKSHKNYDWLRTYANEALNYHIGDGYYAIKAQVFMDKIIEMTDQEISTWLDSRTPAKAG